MGNKTEGPIWKTYLLLTITTMIWGSAFIGGKFATQDFEPVTVAFFRFSLASLILIPIVLIRKEWPKHAGFKDWFLFSCLGLTGIFLYNVAFFMATKHAPIIKSSLFIASNPIVIVVLSGLFLKEVITRNQVMGLISAVIGVFYIIINGQFNTFFKLGFKWIDLVLLLAVFSWALYTVLGKVVLQKYSPLVSTTFACTLGSLFLLPFAIWKTDIQDVYEASAVTWFWTVEMAVLVTVVSFMMYYTGVKRIGASKAALFINFMPVSAVLMAFLFLDEKLTLHHVIGALFVFGGVFLGTRKKRTVDSLHVQRETKVFEK